MNDEKQLMNIFAQAYLLIAKASKQQPSKEGFLLILEMLGEEGIQECAKVADQGPEAVAKAMVLIIQEKQAQKAANGAKLRYIMLLQGKCQPGYLKKGGRCKPCEKEEGVFRNKADMFYDGGATKNKSRYYYSSMPNGETRPNLERDPIRSDLPSTFINEYLRGNDGIFTPPERSTTPSMNPSMLYAPNKGLPTWKERFNNGILNDAVNRPEVNKLPLGKSPLLEGPYKPDDYRLPSKEKYVVPFRKEGGGDIERYRERRRQLLAEIDLDARTRTEGVPMNNVVYGTESLPIRIYPGITVTAPVTHPYEYHRQDDRTGGYHEWIAPYDSTNNINLMDPAIFLGPYRYTDSRGNTTYYQYSSPDRIDKVNPKYGERKFNKNLKKATPRSQKKAKK